METRDTYKTIAAPSDEILYKEKNSKFFGYAFPIEAESEVKQFIDPLRKKHFNAVHFCYAFQIGTEKTSFRANDDGEPANSAGAPIYGQIQSHGLTNTLIVIVRFFGGTKLGVGGLISAYRTAAQMALEAAEIVERTIDIHYQIGFEYKDMNKVMRIIKEKNFNIVSQQMDEKCLIEISVRKKNAAIALEVFEQTFGITIKKLD
ncbi:YigZ family protein [Flavobacterium sp. CYK-55]|uniref:IMPACT family protein n=1 Tax=Flavobacterium sp. CYK-55 TaxID=2835529 RepID=UPI001BCE76E6|nr:YigZ family protein [Flavobacterium sp. CYK-55]MBS7787491.1 YigZ family protein [Flavobacterium sp. CYK-55]